MRLLLGILLSGLFWGSFAMRVGGRCFVLGLCNLCELALRLLCCGFAGGGFFCGWTLWVIMFWCLVVCDVVW